MRSFLTLVVSVLALAAPSSAQEHDQAHHSQYADLQDRAVKALSAQEIEGLLAGDGLGFALAAELNGLPGPKHVLEMDEELGLTESQRSGIAAVQDAMRLRAQTLGSRIVEAETHLDRMFASGHATEAMVLERTLEIGRLRGELRAAHLNAHLETAQLLEAEQVAEYSRLRGYESGS